MPKKLTKENQIKYVVDILKPFLKKDELIKARIQLITPNSTHDRFNITSDDVHELVYWLYSNLGAKEYFKGSNRILTTEFAYFNQHEFEIPDNIQIISAYAFEYSNIKKLFADSEIQKIIFQNINNISFDKHTFQNSKVKEIYVNNDINESGSSKLIDIHNKYPDIKINKYFGA